MLRPRIKIKIGSNPGWEFTYCNKVNIITSRDNFTRKATILLPQRFYVRHQRIFDVISIGDAVEISMGYYPNMVRRFNGYVTRRVPNSPLQLECEDESWQWKNRFIKPVTADDATLESFIKSVYDGKIGTIAQGRRKIGDWRVPKLSTFLQILDTLRNTFGITAYWDLDGALNIDAQLEQLSTVQDRIYQFSKNLINADGMNFEEAAEYSQIVHYSSIQDELNEEDGTPIENVEVYSFYDQNGKIQSKETDPGLQGNINRFTIPYFTYDELKKLSEARLEKLNFTGYRGRFLTFGEPVANVNDDCQIINIRSPEMTGRYRIKGVEVSYDINQGYKQDIEVARKTG